jgi:hypothetical protein
MSNIREDRLSNNQSKVERFSFSAQKELKNYKLDPVLKV